MQATNRKKQKQYISVYVRQRPFSKQELEERSPSIIYIPSSKEVCVKHHFNEKFYQFDHVFGPEKKQEDVYYVVLEPVISEILDGFNCTVFTYGQTGTGKTYTVSGSQSSNQTSEIDSEAGLITRAAIDIFRRLSKPSVLEHAVRVSFIEIYNEELKDLLRDQSENFPLRIYDDRKQKGAVVIQNLFEQTVCSEEEIYMLLQEGMEKRKTASTLLNDQSSRSHSVFTISIHMKEVLPNGEQVVKCGKLNLVDLAGSENIGKSGAVSTRAREAGNINQSLLTLGRVITALVEQNPHIPYRESKLTRILQDSLGGRTKTSIIATISPSLACMEETISTLDYAKRACNIMNCPEANKKSSRERAVTMLTKEVESLQKDITALRSGSGFYVHSDNYKTLLSDKEKSDKIILSQNETIARLEQKIVQMQKEIELEQKRWDELMESFNFTTLKTKEYKLRKLKTEAEKKVQRNLTVLYEERGKVITEKNENLVRAADYSTNAIDEIQTKINSLYQLSEEDFNMNEKIMDSLDDSVSTTLRFIQDSKEVHKQTVSQINTAESEILELNNQLCDQNKDFMANLDKLSLGEQASTIKHNINKQILECVEEKNYVLDQVEKLNCTVKQCVDTTFNELFKDIPEFVKAFKEQSNKKEEVYTKLSLSTKEIYDMQLNFLQEQTKDLKAYQNNTNETLTYFNKEFTESLVDAKSQLQDLQTMKAQIETLIKDKESEIGELTGLTNSIAEVKESINDGIEEQIKKCDDCVKRLGAIPDQLQAIATYHQNATKSVSEVEYRVLDITRKASELQTLIENSMKQLTGNYTANTLYQQYAQKIKEDGAALQDSITFFENIMKASVKSTEKMSESINESISAIKNQSNKIDYHDHLLQEIRKKLMNELEPSVYTIAERLTKLEPTGATPKRQEYKYEKDLIKGVPACKHNLLDADTSVGALDISNSISVDLDALENILEQENISINDSVNSTDLESSLQNKQGYSNDKE